MEPTILQDIRYAQPHNFVGHEIPGYEAAECVLTLKAAKALQKIQTSLVRNGYSLMVYDCYRPSSAVRYFVDWVIASKENDMQREFYPNLTKAQLLSSGYVARSSAHSRGSAVDVAIVLQHSTKSVPQGHQPPCNSPNRFQEGGLDFGTNYDCMDVMSHTNNGSVSNEAKKNRLFLVSEMLRGGFENYYREWWHFKLSNEPYLHTCFDFPITAPRHLISPNGQ